MNRYYETATNALTDADAIIDKLVGDEVVALFLPALAGADHAAKAIEGPLPSWSELDTEPPPNRPSRSAPA